MKRKIESEVIVYHDETKNAGNKKLRGHVLLFVPIIVTVKEENDLFGTSVYHIKPFNDLFKKLEKVREDFHVKEHKFHFSEISGKKWSNRNEAEKEWVQIAVESLKQKKTKNPLYCKLGIIFYDNPTQNHISLYGGKSKSEKKLRFEETLLRFLLKGVVHYLYDNDHKVKIARIITDGSPHHRRINEIRILKRLLYEVRDYVEISEEAELIHLLSDHKQYINKSGKYIHANLLQLTDMLLGSVIQACLKDTRLEVKTLKIGSNVNDKKSIIAYSIKEMLDKRKRGRGFINSSHYKSFTISRAYVENGKWKFENIMPKEIVIDKDTSQLALFDLQVKKEGK